jgi:hypothetical protein
MKTTDIFTPGKTPTVTLVDEHLKKLRIPVELNTHSGQR